MFFFVDISILVYVYIPSHHEEVDIRASIEDNIVVNIAHGGDVSNDSQ